MIYNMDRTVKWEDIEMYRFIDFHKSKYGTRPFRVELKNGEILTIDCWFKRIQQHIDEHNFQHLLDALVEYWRKNPNGDTPEFAAYKSYAAKVFNMPTWAGFKEFKLRGLYVEELGDIYPWPTSK